MRRFVLDASIALAWFVDRPISPLAKHAQRALLSGYRALIPALWHLEMANGLVVAERRGILSRADVDLSVNFLDQLLTSAIETAELFLSTRQALNAARSLELSAYDASYLELAREHRLPLATLDKQLAAAARKVGVELLS